MTIGYAITLVFAVGLTFAYFTLVKKREFWLSLLYICVTVVNLGYLLLSLSQTVEFAIFANDVAYLGSVFLSMCMLFTVIKLCGFKVKKIHVIVCVTLGSLMFATVATVGILPWYYKEVSLTFIDGSARLIKEYGPLHNTYLVYLLGYFVAMIFTIIRSIRRKKHGSYKFAGLIAAVVCGNILVWLIEKFINWEFEFLSVTYIISELMLLFLYWMIQDYIHKNEVPPPIVKEVEVIKEKQTVIVINSAQKAEMINRLLSSLPEGKILTAKEIEILESLIEGKSRKEIAAENHVSENTIKTHISHVYEKFEVSNRESLMAHLESQTK